LIDTRTTGDYCKDGCLSSVLGVTCCDSETSTTGDRPGCKQKLDFDQAEAHCAVTGQVLCSRAQISGGAGTGTGCGFDTHHVWTRDACETTPMAGCYQLAGCSISGFGGAAPTSGCGAGSAWQQPLPSGLEGDCGCKQFCSQYAQAACNMVWSFDVDTHKCTCEGVAYPDISVGCTKGGGPGSAPSLRSGHVDAAGRAA
jgi:hypothetical protein